MNKKLKAELSELAARLKKIKAVKAALVFGSHAKNKQKKESDIDVCVISEGGDDEALQFSSEKYDVSLFSRLPLTFKYRVFKDGKVLFSKDDKLFTKLKFWTITHYLDEKHFRDRFVEKVLA